jgi:hypothetical protein
MEIPSFVYLLIDEHLSCFKCLVLSVAVFVYPCLYEHDFIVFVFISESRILDSKVGLCVSGWWLMLEVQSQPWANSL